MSIAGKIISFITKRSADRFEQATKQTRATQLKLLQQMVDRNKDTVYGRRHGFGAVVTEEDYAGRVPIVNYDVIADLIKDTVNGKPAVLTAESPRMFAQTSGTTGDAKYIPVTPSCQGGAHKDVMRTWLNHAHRKHPDIFSRKCVTLVSPAIEGHTDRGLPFGSTSGHIYKNMPGIVRRAYSIPYSVFEIEDYEAKYYVIMRLSLEHDVRLVCSANPSSILKMCEKADEHAEAIIRDIRDGTLRDDLDIPGEIYAELSEGLKANPRISSQLETARSHRGGRLLPADYWPDLSLIGCWKGGTVGHYVERFDGWFDPDGKGSVPVRDWGYLSSEARGSIPLSDQGSEGVLTVATNFFEFVPVADVDGNSDDMGAWSTLRADQVEVGKEYYILITTTGGLYRYDINDIVEVTGFYNEAPKIVFKRKGRGMTNITGEKVSVNQIIQAFDEATSTIGIRADHYKAEADHEKSRYAFIIEEEAPLRQEQREQLLMALDERLKHINIEYKSKRDSQRLNPPILRAMRKGWYEESRRAQVSGGKRQFQAKTVLLSPTDDELSSHSDDSLVAVVEWPS